MAGTLLLTDAPDAISDGSNIVFDESGGALVDNFGVALRTEANAIGRVFLNGLRLTEVIDTLTGLGAAIWVPITGALSVVDEPDILTVVVGGWWPKRSASRPWSESPDPVGGWTKLNPSSGGWSRAS